jgi:hypothetical protein
MLSLHLVLIHTCLQLRSWVPPSGATQPVHPPDSGSSCLELPELPAPPGIAKHNHAIPCTANWMSAVTDECLSDLHWVPLQDILSTINKMGAKQRDLSFSMSVMLDDVRGSEGRLGVLFLAGDPDEHGQSMVEKAGREDAGVSLFALDFSADYHSTTKQLNTTAGDAEGWVLSTEQVRDVSETEKGHYKAIKLVDNEEENLAVLKGMYYERANCWIFVVSEAKQQFNGVVYHSGQKLFSIQNKNSSTTVCNHESVLVFVRATACLLILESGSTLSLKAESSCIAEIFDLSILFAGCISILTGNSTLPMYCSV